MTDHEPPPAIVGVLAAALVLLGAAGTASAVDVQITIVRAAERGPSDAQLLELRPRLRRLAGYRSFRVVQEERRSCPWRRPQAFVLPDGRLFHVVPKGMRDQAVMMQVKVHDGRRALLDADVQLQNRGVMLFGVDQDGRAVGEALIIMLRAEEDE